MHDAQDSLVVSHLWADDCLCLALGELAEGGTGSRGTIHLVVFSLRRSGTGYH
jgi:hypothetical protein